MKLNVGAGADAREITVPAFGPYAAVKANDFVSVNWNTFSQHWDIGSFQGGAKSNPAVVWSRSMMPTTPMTASCG